MPSEKGSSRPLDISQKEFEAIVARANTGDLAALRQLQKILDERPEIWKSIGDLARNAELAMIRLIAKKDTLLRESLQRSLKALRQDISPIMPSPLEKLLIERVVITWIRIQYIETVYASTTDLSLSEAKFAVLQRESGQKLFDAAVKSLLTVRDKLGQLPAPTSHPPATDTRRSNAHFSVVRAAG